VDGQLSAFRVGRLLGRGAESGLLPASSARSPKCAPLGRADIVSLHLPLTPATRRLPSASRLARMRPGAVLINTARGGLVDETALAAGLVAGRTPDNRRRRVEH
jgi:D-isomer specific 2-hydroxyacid dehydrogenase, NAD binding domain